MVIKYSSKRNTRGDEGSPPKVRAARPFCVGCALCLVLGALIALTILYFLEQVMFWFVGLGMTPLGAHQIEVEVLPSDPAIELCIRDFACQDGDRVELMLNGTTVFQGELLTKRRCLADLEVRLGDNTVELKALNGSGGKGGCPNNINTGALAVYGVGVGSTSEYSWRQLEGETGRATVVAAPTQ